MQICFITWDVKTVGLVGSWDCVAFDEVAGIKFKDKDGIQIMKRLYGIGFFFARGKEEKAKTASMVFVEIYQSKCGCIVKRLSSSFDPFPKRDGN